MSRIERPGPARETGLSRANMEIDNVPCALCDERVYVDEKHVRLTADFRACGRRDEEFVAHVHCVDDLNEAEP